jgi:hypothetical protein
MLNFIEKLFFNVFLLRQLDSNKFYKSLITKPSIFILKRFLSLLLFFFFTISNLNAQISGTSGLDGPQNAVSTLSTFFQLDTKTALNVETKVYTLSVVNPDGTSAIYLDPTKASNDPRYIKNGFFDVLEVDNNDYELLRIPTRVKTNFKNSFLNTGAKEGFTKSVFNTTICDAITDGSFNNLPVGNYPFGVGQWTPMNILIMKCSFLTDGEMKYLK